MTLPTTPTLRATPRQGGATLVEFVVVVPTLLFLLMNLIQYGLLYHTKSQLNYAAFEAARAGTTANASPAAIRGAFTRAMTGYYGGGTTTAQLAASYLKAQEDINFGVGVGKTPAVRIEILSPTKESFDDFNSPALAAKLGAGRVIPNSNLAFISCPVDAPGCAADPGHNTSGQTLQDANLLKLRITYGIAERRQIPLAGPFMNWALSILNKDDTDAFRAGLVKGGRIPLVTHTVMRMQSPAFENGNASSPGAGNDGKPVDPGPLPPGPELPSCPLTDPSCASQPRPRCDPDTDPTCKPVPPCNPATDPTCKPVDPPCDKTPAPAPGPKPGVQV